MCGVIDEHWPWTSDHPHAYRSLSISIHLPTVCQSRLGLHSSHVEPINTGGTLSIGLSRLLDTQRSSETIAVDSSAPSSCLSRHVLQLQA